MLEINRCYYQDCLEGMKEIDDNSVDLIVTDPPYGIAFMGKDWDKAIPKLEIWQECLRVLKHGAFAFIMSSPRQDVFSRMVVKLEDAGFKTGLTSLYWTYASGFPKAQNISKAVDKKFGVEREVIGYENPYKDDAIRKATGNVIDDNVKFLGKYNLDNGLRNITTPSTPQAIALNGSYGGFQTKPAVEVIIVVMKPLKRLMRSDFWNRDKIDYFYTSKIEINDKNKTKLERHHNTEFKLKDVLHGRIAINPSLSDEVLLNGIVIRSKDYRDTDISSFDTQALWNRKGITWLDDGRIPYFDESDKWSSTTVDDIRSGNFIKQETKRHPDLISYHNPQGRFPANLLVSDDVLDDGAKRISTRTKSIGGFGVAINTFGLNSRDATVDYERGYDDEGTFSRYFDLDAWFLENVKKLPKEVQKTFPFLIVPKASKGEKNKGCEKLEPKQKWLNGGGGTGISARENIIARNVHPTVKPLKLMHYLITIGSREEDIVLDPFLGSGTTALACRQLNRTWIGFETDKANKPIIDGRLSQKSIREWQD